MIIAEQTQRFAKKKSTMSKRKSGRASTRPCTTPVLHVSHQKKHICSFILVLSVFVVEFLLKITFSAKKFLKSWVHIFDALIVISSWILMLIMLNKNVKNGMIAEFLIAFRVIRLIHGMKEALEEANELLHENLTEEVHG